MDNMFLIYVKNFPVEALTPEFPRPQEFFNQRPEFVEMQKIIIDSIRKDGLKYPLCARNKLDDGKTFHVGMGMQRLAALKEMGAESCKTVIACKPDQMYIPAGEFIKDKQHLEQIFGCTLRRFVLKPNCFEAQPNEDPKQWDPIRLKK